MNAPHLPIQRRLAAEDKKLSEKGWQTSWQCALGCYLPFLHCVLHFWGRCTPSESLAAGCPSGKRAVGEVLEQRLVTWDLQYLAWPCHYSRSPGTLQKQRGSLAWTIFYLFFFKPEKSLLPIFSSSIASGLCIISVNRELAMKGAGAEDEKLPSAFSPLCLLENIWFSWQILSREYLWPSLLSWMWILLCLLGLLHSQMISPLHNPALMITFNTHLLSHAVLRWHKVQRRVALSIFCFCTVSILQKCKQITQWAEMM